MKNILLVIIGVVILVGLIMYLTRETDIAKTPEAETTADTAQTAEMPTVTATTTTATSTGATATATSTVDVLAVTVHGGSYKFDPATITAEEGQTVRVTFVSDGGLHDFTLDEFAGAKTKQLQGGASETIEFVADKKGAFTYYCSVGNHRAMGMEGTFSVK